MHEKLIILDFGSQTTQLIGRRVRELNMYCEIVPYNKVPHDATDVKGVILSGSPYSVYDENAFKADLTEIRGKYPVLGICYGAQFLAYTSGGNVEPANSREYGRAKSAHIMMALDNRTCDRQRLDQIRINRTLPQPLDIFQLMRLLIEDIDKSFADDLTFLLRFRNAR